MSCKCQGCGRPYKLDIMVPDDMWERIKPTHKPIGGGLLCGCCICAKIEARIGYGAFNLIDVDVLAGIADPAAQVERTRQLLADCADWLHELNGGPDADALAERCAKLAAEWTPDE